MIKKNRDKLAQEFMTPLSQFFDDFWSNHSDFKKTYGSDFFEKGSYPKVDIVEKPTEVIIEAAVPGMSKEEIDIEISGNELSISGQKNQKTDDTAGSYIHRELKRSSFRRTWTLSNNLDTKNISAEHVNGMLFITIPKLQPDKLEPKTTKISIKS